MKKETWIFYILTAFFVVLGLYFMGVPVNKANENVSLSDIIRHQLLNQQSKEAYTQNN